MRQQSDYQNQKRMCDMFGTTPIDLLIPSLWTFPYCYIYELLVFLNKQLELLFKEQIRKTIQKNKNKQQLNLYFVLASFKKMLTLVDHCVVLEKTCTYQLAVCSSGDGGDTVTYSADNLNDT